MLVVKNLPANAGDTRDMCLIPGSGRSSGGQPGLSWWLRQYRICLQWRRPEFHSLGLEDPLVKGTATHSSILAWEIPWTEESGGLSPQAHRELDTTEWLTLLLSHFQFSSVTQSCLTLWPHGLQHARPPCPSPTPGIYSCPPSRWCHPAISSSIVPFSSHL